MARENVTWGYDRIQGALKNLGHVVAPNTIKKILKRHGIDPAPDRAKRTTWRQFLRTHADSIAGGDFFSTEVWTARGLVTYYTFFVIDLATRAVTIVGSTPNPDDDFMKVGSGAGAVSLARPVSSSRHVEPSGLVSSTRLTCRFRATAYVTYLAASAFDRAPRGDTWYPSKSPSAV